MSNVTAPPFFLTYYNPFKKNSPGLGTSFLNYVKDTSIAGYTAELTGQYVGEQLQNLGDDFRATIQKASEEQQILYDVPRK